MARRTPHGNHLVDVPVPSTAPTALSGNWSGSCHVWKLLWCRELISYLSRDLCWRSQRAPRCVTALQATRELLSERWPMASRSCRNIWRHLSPGFVTGIKWTCFPLWFAAIFYNIHKNRWREIVFGSCVLSRAKSTVVGRECGPVDRLCLQRGTHRPWGCVWWISE